MLKATCATKSSILHIYPQFHSQDSQHSTLTLAVLPGVVVPHLERGTATERHYCTKAAALPRLKWPLEGRGVFILFPFVSNVSLFFPNGSIRPKTEKCSSLSPPLVTLSSQASPLIFYQSLREKRSQTRLESRSLDFPTQKSTWFMFWLAVVFITLWPLLLAG